MAGASHFGDQAWWPLQGSRAVCDIRSSVTRVGRGQVLWRQGGPGSGCPCLPLHAVDAACFFQPPELLSGQLAFAFQRLLSARADFVLDGSQKAWRGARGSRKIQLIFC